VVLEIDRPLAIGRSGKVGSEWRLRRFLEFAGLRSAAIPVRTNGNIDAAVLVESESVERQSLFLRRLCCGIGRLVSLYRRFQRCRNALMIERWRFFSGYRIDGDEFFFSLFVRALLPEAVFIAYPVGGNRGVAHVFVLVLPQETLSALIVRSAELAFFRLGG
jgi:hypothetical protein